MKNASCQSYAKWSFWAKWCRNRSERNRRWSWEGFLFMFVLFLSLSLSLSLSLKRWYPFQLRQRDYKSVCPSVGPSVMLLVTLLLIGRLGVCRVYGFVSRDKAILHDAVSVGLSVRPSVTTFFRHSIWNNSHLCTKKLVSFAQVPLCTILTNARNRPFRILVI